MAQSAQVLKVNPWHRDLADWLLSNGATPGWGGRAAAHFKVSRAWLSTVFNSDAFQDYYLRLRDEVTKPQIFSAREKMLGTLDLSIEMLQEKLEAQGETIPLNGLLETIDVLAKRTGHGEGRAAPEIVNNVLVVTKDDLKESRARMRGVSKPLVLDASVEELSQTTKTDGAS